MSIINQQTEMKVNRQERSEKCVCGEMTHIYIKEKIWATLQD